MKRVTQLRLIEHVELLRLRNTSLGYLGLIRMKHLVARNLLLKLMIILIGMRWTMMLIRVVVLIGIMIIISNRQIIGWILEIQGKRIFLIKK